MYSYTLFLALVSLWSTSALAQPDCTFYVHPDGSEQGDGSEHAPWSLSFAASGADGSVTAGSTVCAFGGVYHERAVIGVSGEEGAYVTFRNYDGVRPVIDGEGVPFDDNGLVFIDGEHHVVFEGFEVRNYVSTVNDLDADGIRVLGAAHHVRIRNNDVHGIAAVTPNPNRANAHGILVWGTAPTAMRDIVIEGNTLHDLTLGNSEALTVKCNVEGFAVRGNHVFDVDNIGIDVVGTDSDVALCADVARNGVVAGNVVENASSCSNPAYGGFCSAGGIYVDAGENVVVEHNRVTGADIGIEIAAENTDVKPTRGVVVRSNEVYRNHIAGIALGGYGPGRAGTEDCVVVGNTLFENDTHEEGNGELWVQHHAEDVVIANNVFVAGSQGLLVASYNPQDAIELDHNLYFVSGGGDGTWVWNGVEYDDFDAYQDGTGNDSAGLSADPRFEAPSEQDFHLQAGSPALDRGDNAPCPGDPTCVGETDIDGQARIQNGTVDLGADEGNLPVATEETVGMGADYRLSSVSPNPLHTRAALNLTVRSSQHVRVAVFDALGRRVALLLDGMLAAGKERVIAWDAGPAPSGVYLIRVEGGRFTATRRVTRIR